MNDFGQQRFAKTRGGGGGGCLVVFASIFGTFNVTSHLQEQFFVCDNFNLSITLKLNSSANMSHFLFEPLYYGHPLDVCDPLVLSNT